MRENGSDSYHGLSHSWMPPDAHTGPVAQDSMETAWPGGATGGRESRHRGIFEDAQHGDARDILEGKASGMKTLIHLPKAETHLQLRAGQGCRSPRGVDSAGSTEAGL